MRVNKIFGLLSLSTPHLEKRSKQALVNSVNTYEAARLVLRDSQILDHLTFAQLYEIAGADKIGQNITFITSHHYCQGFAAPRPKKQ